ncbi:hypothetical protein PG990_015220 [Apiospora arundinis]|uniref:2EXR domain-containing protein n=1 Tax=Apiospora arundinis TaxID=335852 RepID=A0ABR2HLF9_9PEZI
MDDSLQTPANIPDRADGISTAATAVTIPEGPRTFHLFPNLPRELRDLIWDTAVRRAYEPIYVKTAEKPRLFCTIYSELPGLRVAAIDSRREFVAASIILRRGISSLLLTSKDSRRQTRRTLGCPGDERRLPLLGPLARHSYRNRLLCQMMILRNDILCLDWWYHWLCKPDEPKLDLGELRHAMLSMVRMVVKGPLVAKELLRRTPYLETLYLDVTNTRYNSFGRLADMTPCRLHSLDFHREFAWLCDLPPSPLPKHGDEDNLENEDRRPNSGVVDGSGSAEVTRESARTFDYNLILGLLRPVERQHFRDIWTVFADAGVKLRVMKRAQSGSHADRYRH